MTATLGWLDHDPEERERMNRVLALFQENDARDELGLGPIRESIADILFPGTSVLQTRLRYFLFVPWIYRSLEDQRVSSAEVVKKARKLELDLIEPLHATGENGVIGRRARGALKQLPSMSYWAGLGSWGIRRFPGSLPDYHRVFDRYSGRGHLRRRDDGDVDGEVRFAWDPALPPAPAEFPKETDFALTQDEARYVADRIVTGHPGSLLAWLVQDGPASEVAAPWMHPRFGSFRAEHQELLRHARLFSHAMHGAAFIYNVALARLQKNQRRIEEHEAGLEAWASDAASVPLDDWSLERFWFLVQSARHTITPGARTFVASFLQLIAKDRRAALTPAAFELVQRREMMLKGTRSRYVNKRALDEWGGWSALAPATYRWATAQRLLADLHAGLSEA